MLPFDQHAPAPFQESENHNGRQREHTGPGEGQGVLRALEMSHEPPAMQSESERDSAGGDLRQCHPHEHELSQEQVNPDQRASQPHQQTHVYGVSEQKTRIENLAQSLHTQFISRSRTSSIFSAVSNSETGPCKARPWCNQITSCA
jgi:hypothetical protein